MEHPNLSTQSLDAQKKIQISSKEPEKFHPKNTLENPIKAKDRPDIISQKSKKKLHLKDVKLATLFIKNRQLSDNSLPRPSPSENASFDFTRCSNHPSRKSTFACFAPDCPFRAYCNQCNRHHAFHCPRKSMWMSMYNVLDPDFHREFKAPLLTVDFKSVLDAQASLMKQELNAMVDSLTWQWKNEVLLTCAEPESEYLSRKVEKHLENCKKTANCKETREKQHFDSFFDLGRSTLRLIMQNQAQQISARKRLEDIRLESSQFMSKVKKAFKKTKDCTIRKMEELNVNLKQELEKRLNQDLKSDLANSSCDKKNFEILPSDSAFMDSGDEYGDFETFEKVRINLEILGLEVLESFFFRAD